MKQTVNLIGSLIFLACLVSPAWAVKGPADVSETVHNLSSGAFWNLGYSSDNVDEVCVFCHTPHGGSLTGPLWNRSNPGGTFTHYNSVTLSTTIVGDTRAVNNESLICMSCHDGSVAVDHLLNKPNSIGTDPVEIWGGNVDVTIIDSLGGNPYARIGATLADTTKTGDLSDDHPISFSYDAVLGDTKYTDSASSYYQELHDVTYATSTGGVRFFGPTHNVECSSCHDPHVNYDALGGGNELYRPFLITPNTGSALCLACHDK